MTIPDFREICKYESHPNVYTFLSNCCPGNRTPRNDYLCEHHWWHYKQVVLKLEDISTKQDHELWQYGYVHPERYIVDQLKLHISSGHYGGVRQNAKRLALERRVRGAFESTNPVDCMAQLIQKRMGLCVCCTVTPEDWRAFWLELATKLDEPFGNRINYWGKSVAAWMRLVCDNIV